jgi:hypothetical protein
MSSFAPGEHSMASRSSASDALPAAAVGAGAAAGAQDPTVASLAAGMTSLQVMDTAQTEEAPHPPAVSSTVGTEASRREDVFAGVFFAGAVAPLLTNAEIFALSGCSRKLLRLRYDLGRWAVVLNTYRGATYESFRIKRTAVPVCFPGLLTFDLAEYLGPRLSVSMHDEDIDNADALAGVHSLDLSSCNGLRDVRHWGVSPHSI